MLIRKTLRGLFLAAAVSASPIDAHTVATTQKLCVLAGLRDARAPGQANLKLYGTDLGITYARNNKLEILFGDTWATDTAAPPDVLIPRDDAYGTIDLLTFPDGDAVEARCNQGAGTAPPIVYDTTSSTTLATLNPGVAMDGLKPVDVLVGGDPRQGAIEQYAPGGILRHPGCENAHARQPTCAPHSAPLTAKETGALYGVNLIDQWTEMRTGGAVDLYWNVSTWDPYRVMLMKTRITP